MLLATLRELAVAVPLLEGDSAARVAALVESTVHDNWRVRAALNGALPAVALARGKDAFEAQLLEGFVRSFQDRISEVRTSAVAVLGSVEINHWFGGPHQTSELSSSVKSKSIRLIFG